MEHQWNDIKTAYRRILNTAFRTQEEKDYAHVTFLRFLSSFVDLTLSGDPTLHRALLAILGGISEENQNSFHSPNTQQQNPSEDDENDNDNVPNRPNLSTLPRQDSELPNNGGRFNNLNDFNNFISNAESLFNHFSSGGRNPEGNNNNISATEFRNMFPIFHYMFEEPRQEHSTPSATPQDENRV